jgi:hypothetical protein
MRSIPKIVVPMLTVVLISLNASNASSQTQDLRDELLRAFDNSTKELEIGTERVRGHEIGKNKFKPCRGKEIEIRNRPLHESDKCAEPGRPTGISFVTAVIVGWDPATLSLDVRMAGEERTRLLYVPESVLQVKDNALSSMNRLEFNWTSQLNREVMIFFAIPERMEGIAFTNPR